MFRLGLVDTLVTHANIKGFGLTPLSGACHGYMPSRFQKEVCWPLKDNRMMCHIYQIIEIGAGIRNRGVDQPDIIVPLTYL